MQRPAPATFEELCKFHSEEYIRFLRTITPDNTNDHAKQMQRFNVGEDSPVFDGLYNFCQASSGGSIGGAVKLNKGQSDVAINWAGGLHHAKKCEASGFCYANDIVLAILELLKGAKALQALDLRGNKFDEASMHLLASTALECGVSLCGLMKRDRSNIAMDAEDHRPFMAPDGTDYSGLDLIFAISDCRVGAAAHAATTQAS